MIAIDLGHRFGRLARTGPDGRPAVTAYEFDGVDGLLDPARALPALLAAAGEGMAGEGTAAGPDRSAVLGLPAGGEGEDGLRRAAEAAGLCVERVVPEPVAVALHYRAVAEGVDRTVLVCDQGATTLDLTVLAITPDLTVRILRTRREHLGGDDWDAALAARLTGRLPEGTDPRRAAALLRRGIGAADEVVESLPAPDGGRHEVVLTRAELDLAVAPPAARMLAAVAEELAAEPAVDTVLLAGGLCATPGHRTGIEALPAARHLTVRCHQPELAVVQGLLLRQEFGVLRVLTGPGPRTSRPPDGYFPKDPAPRSDPRPSSRMRYPVPGELEEPEDPQPRPRPSTAPPRRVPGPEADGVRAAEPMAETATRPTPPGPVPSPAASSPTAPGPDAPPVAPAIPEPRRSEDAPPPPPPSPERTATSVPSPDPVGEPRPAGLLAVPVADLQADRRGDHLLVLWAWPDGALSARVRWRREGSGALDGRPDGDLVCRRRVYEHDGGLDLAVGRGAVTLTVEALVAGAGVDCEGAAALIVPAQPPLVQYEPAVRRRFKGRTATVTFTAESGCDLPDLRIVHSLGRFRPANAAEGTVVHEVRAQRLSARTPLTVEFPLPATRGPSWLVCFPVHGDAGAEAGIDIRPTELHRLRVT
ncbi:hypothetical protein GCM10009760_16070 [Kitasatospora kazusensis]|uniref:Hsp70 protein n=1 Tax=Kitasatospora kazusensis TaxID=407974 RepID=A0ABP5KS28_9ACTN